MVTRSAERRIESRPRDHWLDYAQAAYGSQLVNDIKVLFRILLLYVPLPLFWALFDQQGSRWTFQASRMDGDVGAFTIKPDQMQVVNPVLIIALIPLFDAFIYPQLARIGLRRPLQKLTVGMILVAVSFAMSALLELKLESLDPVLPGPAEAQVRVFNGIPSGGDWVLRTRHDALQEIRVPAMGLAEWKHVPLRHAEAIEYTAEETGSAETVLHGVFNLRPAEADSYFITNRANRGGSQIVSFVDAPGKPTQDQPLLRVLFTSMVLTPTENGTRTIVLRSHRTHLEREMGVDSMALQALAAGQYAVYVDGRLVDDGVSVYTGGVYTYLLSEQFDGKFVSFRFFHF